jgi:hypothetical protein
MTIYRKVQNICGQINWRTDRRIGLPFGVTNLKVCSQKIVPIFLFFCLGRDVLIMTRFLKEARPDKVGYFNYGPEKLQVFSGK